MADHVTDVHNIYASASYLPMDELTVYGTAVFNLATASLDPVEMPEVEAQADGHLPHMDYNFEHMHLYSDLDYTIIRLSLGVEYKLSPTWRFTFEGDYAKLEDNAGYVYGVESGSYFIGRAGARFTF